jgi:hypothetical protein
MKTTHSAPFRSFVLLASAAFGLALGGCYSKSESHAFTGIEGDRIGDDYEYYPQYEVYYSPVRRQYTYREGNVWVTRSEAPSTWSRELPDSPTVRVHLNDSPEGHHAETVRQYPRDWKPVLATPARTTNDDVREGVR